MITKILFSAVLILLVWGGQFAYSNFRGAAPAILPVKAPAQNTTGLPFNIPNGFSIEMYAKDLANPRVLAFDPSGTLLVSVPAKGQVLALPEKKIVVSGLNKPHGIAFHDGKLYVAQTDGISVDKKMIIDLPGGGNHFSRTIGFGPDGRLYITVGSSCNVCKETDWRRATMLTANPDGSDLKPFVTGLRNTVFFTWHEGVLWGTDMGRDLLGDDVPPDEVNTLSEGANYGWPYCYGDQVHDDQFDPKKTHDCASSHVPKIKIQAHSAPLGLAFIPDSWPKEYRGDLLVAYHGSWNRSVPIGYKIVRFDLDEKGNVTGQTDFLTGFLQGNTAIGRPVDLVFDRAGNLFISDDKGGVVYKLFPI